MLKGSDIRVAEVLLIRDEVIGTLEVKGGTLTAQSDLRIELPLSTTNDIGLFSVQGGESTIDITLDLEIRHTSIFEVRPTGPGAEGLTTTFCRDLSFGSGQVFGGGVSTAPLRLDTALLHESN